MPSDGQRGATSLGRAGRFELLTRVDAGGMGEIFLAKERALGVSRYLAVKRLLASVATDPTFVHMFLDESRLARLLDHPNICRVYEAGAEGPNHYIAMEWIHGISLRRLLMDGPLNPTQAAFLGAQTARALHYAHNLSDDRGVPLHIVHRDVSPPNIMVGFDGSVKLLDFGLARARIHLHRTQPGYVKGKFGYLAPEQLLGDAAIDGRTDVFALGLVLFEMLTGRMYFDQPTAAATVTAIARYQAPPRVADYRDGVPASLDEIVQRALQRELDDRHPNAEALELELGAFLAGADPRFNSVRMRTYVRERFPEWQKDPLSAVRTGAFAALNANRLETPAGSSAPSANEVSPGAVDRSEMEPVHLASTAAPRPGVARHGHDTPQQHRAGQRPRLRLLVGVLGMLVIAATAAALMW